MTDPLRKEVSRLRRGVPWAYAIGVAIGMFAGHSIDGQRCVVILGVLLLITPFLAAELDKKKDDSA